MESERKRSSVAEIRARTTKNVTDIVSSPREYCRVQQILRDREDLLHAYDALQAKLDVAGDPLQKPQHRGISRDGQWFTDNDCRCQQYDWHQGPYFTHSGEVNDPS